MSEEEARREAAKREKHKSPGLYGKHWVAEEKGRDGSWGVALVEEPWVRVLHPASV